MGHFVDDLRWVNYLPATLHSNLGFQWLLYHFIFQPLSMKCDLTERLNVEHHSINKAIISLPKNIVSFPSLAADVHASCQKDYEKLISSLHSD